jgi:hypothetical protein
MDASEFAKTLADDIRLWNRNGNCSASPDQWFIPWSHNCTPISLKPRP